jgi:Domain of unknown function (DUF4173)
VSGLRPPGLLLLAAGLALGALADATLRAFPWGLNATVVAAGVIGAVLWLQRRQRTRVGRRGAVHAVAALAIAACFLWRDAIVLKTLDGLALLLALGLLASERDDLVGARWLSSYLLRVSGTAAHAAVGPPLLVAHDVDWSGVRTDSVLDSVLGLGRGLVITLPIVLLFTILLANADAVFARGVESILDVDAIGVLGHVAGASGYGWMAAGLFRAAVLRVRPAHRVPPRPGWFALGQIEIALLLGALDLLFGAFVWIQVRYLFGGSEWVQSVAGLTYAQYARRGFFELVAVAVLVLPLLLVTHWLLKPERPRGGGLFAFLAGIQVVLVLVMLVSALERMRLYQSEYGLTELRLYTTALMAWLGTLFLWFLATVLRGDREAFARGVIASAFVALVALHAVNPEGLIVQANRSAPHGFDLDYALGLGADAAPALVDATPSLEPEKRRVLALSLRVRWSKTEEGDWRIWSLARFRASRSVRDAEAELRGMAQVAAGGGSR